MPAPQTKTPSFVVPAALVREKFKELLDFLVDSGVPAHIIEDVERLEAEILQEEQWIP